MREVVLKLFCHRICRGGEVGRLKKKKKKPCDVGIFRPFKKCWQKQVAEHAQLSNRAITKANFAPLFNVAYIKACDPQVIKKSFECCGLYPFNPDIVDYSKCI